MRARSIVRSVVSGLMLGGCAAGLASCSGNGQAGTHTLAAAPGNADSQQAAVKPPAIKSPAALSPEAQLAKPATSGHIVWEKDYETALTKARAANKPVFIDFSTSWCGWCKELERTTYKSPTVITESQNFIAVKVDADQREDLAKRYGATGFPTMVIVDASGNAIDTLEGYVTDQQLVPWMRASYGKFQPFVAA